MARIQFKEGESIVGTAIIIALLGALLVAAILFAWEHHQNKINGTDRNPSSSELKPIVVTADSAGA
jgi:hypothetical protein